MALLSLEGSIAEGQRLGLSPEDIADGLKQWRNAAAAEAADLYQKNSPDSYWKGLAKIDEATNSALMGLKSRAYGVEARKQFDSQEQFDAFNTELKAANFDPSKISPDFQPAAEAISARTGGDSFKPLEVQRGTIGQGSQDLGIYEVRPSSTGSGYDALVIPKGGDKTPFIVPVSGDRAKMIGDSDTRINELTTEISNQGFAGGNKPDKSTMFLPAEGQAFAMEARAKQQEKLTNELDSAKAKRDLGERGKLSDILHLQLSDTLRTDDKFLKTIPNDIVEQFTSRTAKSVLRSTAQAYAGITGEGKDALTAAGQEAVDIQSPGLLRSRFAAGDKTSVGDQVSQGVESLIGMFGPGILGAGSAKVIGGVGKLAASAASVESKLYPIATQVGELAGKAEEVSNKLGWSSMFGTSYGSNYAGALQEADAVEATDPVRAKKIRDFAQISSVLNAGIEMGSEKIFGDETRALKGQRLPWKDIVLLPLKEPIEEGFGAEAQNLVSGFSGQSGQDVGDAGIGGFYGSFPFVGGAAIRNLRGKAPTPAASVQEAAGRVVGVAEPAINIAEATGDSAAAEVIRKATVVAGMQEAAAAPPLSTVPVGESTRAALDRLDLSRPLNEEAEIPQPDDQIAPAPDQIPVADAQIAPAPSAFDGEVTAGLDGPTDTPLSGKFVGGLRGNTQDAFDGESPPTAVNPETPPVEDAPVLGIEPTPVEEVPTPENAPETTTPAPEEPGVPAESIPAAEIPVPDPIEEVQPPVAEVAPPKVKKPRKKKPTFFDSLMPDVVPPNPQAVVPAPVVAPIATTPSPVLATQPSKVRTTLRQTYNRLKAKSGFSSIFISDLQKESGLPLSDVKAWIQSDVIGKGIGNLDENDWSAASEEQRAAAVEQRDRKRLAVTLHDEVPTGEDSGLQGNTTVTETTTVPPVSNENPAAVTETAPTPPENNKSTSTAEAEKIVNTLNSRGNSLRVEENPDDAAKEAATRFKELTGKDVVFVRGKEGDSDGAALPGGKAVVVNLDAKQPLKKLIGHEVTHTLEGTPAYEALKKSLKTTDRYSDYRAKLEGFGYSEQEIDGEFMADVVGESANNRKFWRSLFQENPTLFQKVADATLGVIDKLKEAFSGSKRKGASKYVANLTEFQDRLRDILKSLRPRDLEMIREYGADPSKWAASAQADAVAALNGDELAFSRLNHIQQRAVGRVLAEVEDDLRESRESNPQDREYLKAVVDGDVETQQRLVDEAAKAAGYTTKAYHETGDVMKSGHTVSGGDFTEFRPSKFGALGPGIYLAPDKSNAQEYAKRFNTPRLVSAYVKLDNPFIGGTVSETSSAMFSKFPAETDQGTIEAMKAAGYDGVIATKSESTKFGVVEPEMNVFNPNQIKSADPVTYDNNGNPIPLSQRFNPQSNDIRESRENQRRGGADTLLLQESVREADVAAAVDALIPRRNTIDGAADMISLLNNISKNSQEWQDKMTALIEDNFRDYLKKFSADLRTMSKKKRGNLNIEDEKALLKIFVSQAAQARALKDSKELFNKGGITQRKQAARLVDAAVRASRIRHTVAIDSTAAGRLLRFSQLRDGGDVASMLAQINSQQFKYVDKAYDVDADDVTDSVDATEDQMSGLAEATGTAVTPGAKFVFERQKAAIKEMSNLAAWIRSKIPKESREANAQKGPKETTQTIADKADTLVEKLKTDYSNAEDVLEEMYALLNGLPLEQQEEAISRFNRVMEADNKVADAEKTTKGTSRKLDQVARALIKSVDAIRNPKVKISQDAQDFAALRDAVRDQSISPQAAVDAFEALGGSTELSESLLDAFDKDLQYTLKKDDENQQKVAQREQIKADAKESADMVKVVKSEVRKAKQVRSRVEATALAEAEAAVASQEKKTEDAIKKASRLFGNQDVPNKGQVAQAPIREVVSDIIAANPQWDPATLDGKESVMREALDQRGVSPDIVDAVLRNSADAFDNLIKSIQDAKALRAEIQAERKIARQDAKDTRAAVSEAKKEALDKKMAPIRAQARIDKQATAKALAEIRKGARLFGNQDVPTAPKKAQSLSKILDVTMKAHPEWSTLDEAGRRSIVEDVLRQKGYSEANIPKIMDVATSMFEDRLSTAAAAKFISDVDKAEKLFDLPKKSDGKAKPSLSQTITDLIMNNSDWEISDPADKRKLIESVLLGKGFSKEVAAKAAVNAVTFFNEQLEKIEQQNAAKFLKELKGGKLKQDTLFKAIRLRLLDPSKSIAVSLAAEAGFKGLSPEQLSTIYQVGKDAADVQSPQVRVALLLEQLRIIYSTAGLNPAFADAMSATLRASTYSGVGSVVTNYTAPFSIALTVLGRELAVDLAKNPIRGMRTLSEHVKAFATSVRNASRSYAAALVYDSTKGFSVSKDTMGAAKKMEGIVDVDALTRRYDRALATLEDPKTSTFAKAKAAVSLVYASQRVLWKIFGAADSFIITLTETHLNQLNTLRGLRKQKVDPQQARREFDAFYNAKESAARHGVEKLNLSKNLANMEATARMEAAYVNWLRDEKAFESKEILSESLREAVFMAGNHEEVQGLLSATSQHLAEYFSHPRLMGFGPLISRPIRIVGNIADMAMWWAPFYGMARVLREDYRHAVDDKKKIERGGVGSISKFTLAALTDSQLNRRRAESIAGTLFYIGIKAILGGQPDDDDDKTVIITAGYPTFDKHEQDRWKRLDLKEYTIYLGKGNRTPISYTRGILDYLAFPLIVATRMDKLEQGKTTVSATVGGMLFDVINVATPSISGNSRDINTLQQGKDALADIAGYHLAGFVPYSSLQRSVAKMFTDPVNKDASGYQWSSMFPAAAFMRTDGDIELRNALDEKIEFNNTFWQKLSVIGVPFISTNPQAPHDAALRADFEAMDYIVPRGYDYTKFLEDITGQEEELIKRNGVANVTELFTKANSIRGGSFKEIYHDDPRPDKNSDDQRYVQERLKQGDKKAYSSRMGTFWGEATKAMKKELGIEKP